jgi:hypothetical protein
MGISNRRYKYCGFSNLNILYVSDNIYGIRFRIVALNKMAKDNANNEAKAKR